MRMKFGKDVFLGLGLATVAILAGCVDHVADGEAELEQVRQDSIVQADADNLLFDQYIADASNSIDESQVVVGDFGVRHIVWDPATSTRTPEYNELVSVHYVGKFLDNDIFDTSNAMRAKRSDSLDYVSTGLSFEDLLAKSEASYEGVLDSLNRSDGAIDDPLFSLSRTYLPLVFDHQENGSGIATNFIFGFRNGLKEVMLKMELNSKALIMIPSVIAYGSNGTIDSAGEVVIPPNTPLLFEFSLVNIRP